MCKLGPSPFMNLVTGNSEIAGPGWGSGHKAESVYCIIFIDIPVSFSLSFTGQADSNLTDSLSGSVAIIPMEEKTEKIKLPVVEFPVEEPWLKWLLRLSTIALLITLIGLWIRFA